MREHPATLIPQLNGEQRAVFDAISIAVNSGDGGAFMIDAPDGAGTTFTTCALSADLRSKGRLVLCSASTGTAALLLPGGLTAHSTFERPFGDNLVLVLPVTSKPNLNAPKYSDVPILLSGTRSP
ncbi:unnamed protein product [Hapterophycus canaliculatus]